MSILSGQLISRRGRYRAFPIVGTLLMSVGLTLLSRLDLGTGATTSAAYLLVLGLGLGSVMQVLVLAVQNAVDYSVLGAATSGVTMFRGIGGSLGTAVFGTIFTTRLADQLRHSLRGPLARQASHGVRLTGAQVARLPAASRGVYQQAYVNSLRPVFLVAAGVAALGFALSLLLQERPLRAAAASSTGLEDSMAAPRSTDSLAEIARSLTRVTTRAERMRFSARIAERAGLQLSPGATWALVRVHDFGFVRARALAEEDGVSEQRLLEVVQELADRGLLEGEQAGRRLTAAGRELTERILSSRREVLAEALADDRTRSRPEVAELLAQRAHELCGEPPTLSAVAGAA